MLLKGMFHLKEARERITECTDLLRVLSDQSSGWVYLSLFGSNGVFPVFCLQNYYGDDDPEDSLIRDVRNLANIRHMT